MRSNVPFEHNSSAVSVHARAARRGNQRAWSQRRRERADDTVHAATAADTQKLDGAAANFNALPTVDLDAPRRLLQREITAHLLGLLAVGAIAIVILFALFAVDVLDQLGAGLRVALLICTVSLWVLAAAYLMARLDVTLDDDDASG